MCVFEGFNVGQGHIGGNPTVQPNFVVNPTQPPIVPTNAYSDLPELPQMGGGSDIRPIPPTNQLAYNIPPTNILQNSQNITPSIPGKFKQ